jgi:hypothetical protein
MALTKDPGQTRCLYPPFSSPFADLMALAHLWLLAG